MEKDITAYKNQQLLPALHGIFDTAFSELEPRRVSRGWESCHHLDGTRDGAGAVVTYLYDNNEGWAHDHARGESVNLVDLYMNLHGGDFLSAVQTLSDMCGLKVPEMDSEEWAEYKRTQENRETATRVFRKALKGETPEAAKVMAYLSERGWTADDIAKAQLGLSSTAALDEIERSGGDSRPYRVKAKVGDKVVGSVGTTHLLAIPQTSGGHQVGHKFREVGADTGQKYVNAYKTHKGEAFAYLTIGVRDAVIVEGELDALHAQVRGISNVVATMGGGATAAQVRDALKRGVERFTLLFDNDTRGAGFTADTIKQLRAAGVRDIYITQKATEEGEKDGKSMPYDCKDIDEFFAKGHTKAEFDGIIANAVPYFLHDFFRLKERFADLNEEKGGLTMKEREDFLKQTEEIYDDMEQKDTPLLLKHIRDVAPSLLVDMDGWEEHLMQGYFRKQERTRAEEVRKALADMQAAANAGDTDRAVRLMKDTAKAVGGLTMEAQFTKSFTPPTIAEVGVMLSEVNKGLPTGFVFKKGHNETTLTLNAGLTFVCGYTGHGKTSFLNCLALNEATRCIQLNGGDKVLYFSYEIDKPRLIRNFLNTYVNDPNLNNDGSEDAILSYFRGEGDRYFQKSHYGNFVKKQEEFLRGYISSGVITIVGENYKAETLLDGIKFHLNACKHKVSAVFIDYAQLLYSEVFVRQRTEEIKKIVNDIKDFANAERLPFVLAAQFNREIYSPTDLVSNNIGEGGDFERIADTCIGLFNLTKLLSNGHERDTATKKLLAPMLFFDDSDRKNYLKADVAPIDGKAFVRLMKRRNGYYPIDMLFDWTGATQYIKPNRPDLLKVETGKLLREEVAAEGQGYNEDLEL